MKLSHILATLETVTLARAQADSIAHSLALSHGREPVEWRLNHVLHFHGSGILLLRNPFLAIRSSWNHFTTESLTDVSLDLEENLIRSPQFQTFAHAQIDKWRDTATDWLLLGTPGLLVVHYELLVEDLDREVDRIEEHFGVATDQARRDCLRRNKMEKFRRKHVRDERNYYGESAKEKIGKAIADVDKLLKQRGREGLPLHLYKIYREKVSI